MDNKEKDSPEEALQQTPGNTAPGDSEQGHPLLPEGGQAAPAQEEGPGQEDIGSGAKVDQ